MALAGLMRDQHGVVLASANNAILILTRDDALTPCFGRNAFTADNVLLAAVPSPIPQPAGYPRSWTVADIFLVMAYLHQTYSHRFGFETVERAMITAASSRIFHPVLDYLETLVWDGTQRIDTWLSSAFNCPDDAYHQAIGAKFLVACIRRVRDPGCQFDHMPVLEGAQNLGKSRSCRALFGDKLFTDDMPADFRNKDSPLALLGKWGIELSEIDQLIRQDVEVLKAFLSRRVDRFRPPYGRGFIEQPRQCVFIGTTNSDDYLRDTTGNRRVWPVRCTRADFGWIAEHRDQLWAEACQADTIGEPIWLDAPGVAAAASQAQAERLYEDVWTPVVADHLENRTATTTRDVLGSIGIPTERQDKRAEMRAASILRCLGWVRQSIWNASQSRMEKRWVRPRI